jgi:aspartate aminotransferase
MITQIAERVRQIKESPTLAIASKAQQMKANGIDVINLSTGEPDFDTPKHIKEAAIGALKRGFTKYTAVTGTAELKKAIIEKFKRDNGVTYTADEIIVSSGGKHVFFNLCMAYLNAGDEVIIPAPYWVSYPDIVLVAQGIPIFIECDIEKKYKLTPEQLKKAITPKTRMLVINSPANPTGAIYSIDELKALAQILIQYPSILVVSDDIYEHILLKKVLVGNMLNVAPQLKQQTILINGVSKTYAMTGWRIGYAGGPNDLIKAMGIMQSQSTSSPCSIAQVAAEVALNSSQECLKPMLDAFKMRHQLVIQYFNQIQGLKYLPAQGAFYAFINAREAIDHLAKQKKISAKNDLALSNYLLDEYQVAVVPGSAFGLAGYFRISFATNTVLLEKALNRMKRAFNIMH